MKKLRGNKLRRISQGWMKHPRRTQSAGKKWNWALSSSVSPFFPPSIPVGTVGGKRSMRSLFPPRRTTTFLWFHAVGLHKAVCKEGGGGGGVGWDMGAEYCKSNENRCYRQHQDVNNHNSTPNFLLCGFSSHAWDLLLSPGRRRRRTETFEVWKIFFFPVQSKYGWARDLRCVLFEILAAKSFTSALYRGPLYYGDSNLTLPNAPLPSSV